MNSSTTTEESMVFNDTFSDFSVSNKRRSRSVITDVNIIAGILPGLKDSLIDPKTNQLAFPKLSRNEKRSKLNTRRTERAIRRKRQISNNRVVFCLEKTTSYSSDSYLISRYKTPRYRKGRNDDNPAYFPFITWAKHTDMSSREIIELGNDLRETYAYPSNIVNIIRDNMRINARYIIDNSFNKANFFSYNTVYIGGHFGSELVKEGIEKIEPLVIYRATTNILSYEESDFQGVNIYDGKYDMVSYLREISRLLPRLFFFVTEGEISSIESIGDNRFFVVSDDKVYSTSSFLSGIMVEPGTSISSASSKDIRKLFYDIEDGEDESGSSSSSRTNIFLIVSSVVFSLVFMVLVLLCGFITCRFFHKRVQTDPTKIRSFYYLTAPKATNYENQ